jgi:hypothetical protein
MVGHYLSVKLVKQTIMQSYATRANNFVQNAPSSSATLQMYALERSMTTVGKIEDCIQAGTMLRELTSIINEVKISLIINTRQLNVISNAIAG